MVDTLTDKWIKLTEVNNTSFEILNLNKVSVLVFKDFLKYPDELRSLIDELKFNSFLSKNHAKPGKTYIFDHSLKYIYSKFLTNIISKTFLCDGIYCPLISINCFNGDMLSHYNYPHVDTDCRNPEVTIAANVGLTKNLKGGTGFWSYLNKMNMIDMSLHEVNHHTNFMNEQRKNSYDIIEETNSVLDKYRELLSVDKSKSNLYARQPISLEVQQDRKSTRLNSSHTDISRMPSSA